MKMIKLVKLNFIVLAIFILTGCTMGLNNDESPKTNKKVLVNLNIQSNKIGRYISPTNNPLVDRYDLYGSMGDDAQILITSFASIDSAKVLIDPGTWDFTLKAVNSKGNVFLEAKNDGVEVKDVSMNINFTLEPLATGSGSVSITLNWPISQSIATVDVTFRETSSVLTPPNSTNSVIFTADNVPLGTYMVSFSLKNSNNDQLLVYSDTVRIFPEMISSDAIDLNSEVFNSVPTAPTNVTIKSVENLTHNDHGSVSISWTDNSNNETDFEIVYSDNNGETWSTKPQTANATTETYIDNGAYRGSERQYKVRAVNDIGHSEWSDVSNKLTIPYLVEFNLNGGNIDGTMTDVAEEILPNGKITEINPVKDNSVFCHWSTNKKEFNNNSIVTTNMVLNAVWGRTITFNSNGGIGTEYTQVVVENESAKLLACIYSKDKNSFVGWSTTEKGAAYHVDESDFKMGKNNITLYARWLSDFSVPSSDFNYTYIDDAITITEYTGSGGFVVIPELIEIPELGYYCPVTAISAATRPNDGAFYGADISSVKFPETMETIGSYAFYHSEINSAKFSDSITEIGDYAFNYCESLVLNSLPQSLITIGNYAFSKTRFGYGTLPTIISDKVISIGEYAFNGCDSLRSITIGESVETIGSGAFYGSPLSFIDVKGANPPKLESTSSINISNVQRITVLPDSLELFKSEWSRYAEYIIPQS